MVYTISDKVEKAVDLGQQVMDAKFHRVKTTDADEGFGPNEQRRIWKNVLALSVTFMLQFTAFWGASNLQSSVNSEAALGTFTLSSIYGSLLLSNIFLPVMVIRWLGAKWTIACSLILYMPFILAQYYPRFYTMIPAGLMIGFGGGPLWCAKCTYLSVISEAYSQITGMASDIVVTRFFGIFFMFYSFSQVWGNLISSAVLSSGPSDILSASNQTVLNATTLFLNQTQEIETIDIIAIGDRCGANFDPSSASADINPNLTPPPPHKINTIATIYLGCMIAAFLIVCFGVDTMTRYGKGRKGSGGGLSGLNLLAVTLKQLKNPYQILILPITMFIGAEEAFIAADYTSAYVSCGWGINNIGYVMICFGVCNGIASICSGAIVKITGRSPVVCFALAAQVSLIITLLIWRPTPQGKIVFFLISGLWGMCDALWLVQLNSLSGILCPGKEEAAYSNFRLWESTGSVITYAISPYLCTQTKLYLLLGLLIVGAMGYTGVEYLSYKEGRKEDEQVTEKGTFELIKDQINSGEVVE